MRRQNRIYLRAALVLLLLSQCTSSARCAAAEISNQPVDAGNAASTTPQMQPNAGQGGATATSGTVMQMSSKGAPSIDSSQQKPGVAADPELGKLVGCWLMKKAPGPDWTLWSIDATGQALTQYVGGEDQQFNLKADGSVIRRTDSHDGKSDLQYAVKSHDEILLASGPSIAMLVRLEPQRWTAIHDADPGQAFPEFSDNRFDLLKDQEKVRALLANTDQNMKGTWLCQGNGATSINIFDSDGQMTLKQLGIDNAQSTRLWSMRDGDSLTIGSDSVPNFAQRLKYQIVSSDEVRFVDQHGGTSVMIRIPSERADELCKLSSDDLAKTDEVTKLANEFKRISSAGSTQ